MLIKDTYLAKVRQKNKGLFYAIVAYIVISLSIAMRNEMIFFFRWSMYSKRVPYREIFPAYVLEYNNNHFFNIPSTWKDHKKMMFYYTINHYIEIMGNNGREHYQDRAEEIADYFSLPALPFNKMYTTQSELQTYPVWLKRYMQANMDEKIDSIAVYCVWLKYKSDGRVIPVDKNLVFKQ